MRKAILPLFFILVFLSAPDLQASKFFMKMSFGLSAGGDVEDILITSPEYAKYVSIGEVEKSQWGLSVFWEFTYKLNQYIGFSVGNGYESRKLEGGRTEFNSPQFEASYFLTPEFSADIVPITFSLVFSLPVSNKFHLNFSGGVGYYIASFQSKSEWKTSLTDFSTWEYRSWNFKGHAQSFGFHLGTSSDVHLSGGVFLIFDVGYRSIRFDNIESDKDIGQETTFFFLRFYEGGEALTDFDYRLSEVNLSGISGRLGLKFQF